MKKYLLGTAILVGGLTLAACGDGNSSTDPVETEPESTETEGTGTVDSSEDDAGEDVTEDETIDEDGWETKVGETVENEGGTFTLIARQDEVETIETGPMVLTIPQVNASSAELKGDLKAFLEADSIEYIQIDMEVENTSGDTISFYPAQATITTNTGEQLESDLWLSDHIDGDFIGQVSKEGSQFFILEKSKAEEIEWVRILINSPHDDDWNDVGEDVDITVEF
ncbi:hypothetical protein [Alkalihalobacillus pseudalcaliphilus]|uniref:hypothetical protein n=1 Tax=Alkalihalobacillus pseudalcaliphilus TaxID=79884 RepID=UPI00064D7D77|nr:hypothetical protein [Alkalihalobacillus pseudalcaliphilus]KMK77026.1 hypothetical protein AB990_05575 [Alkalihalobacillus pseudalcaliphilus]